MQVNFSAEDIAPIVQAAVAETLSRLNEREHRVFGDRITLSEPELAARLGVQPHTLRDARLRGEITHTKVGRRIMYRPQDVVNYLQQNAGGE